MLYLTCPTCGYHLGNITHKYEIEKEKICLNPKYNTKKKNLEIQKLLKSLGLRRYCCSMRVLTYKDLSKDILPVPKNGDI